MTQTPHPGPARHHNHYSPPPTRGRYDVIVTQDNTASLAEAPQSARSPRRSRAPRLDVRSQTFPERTRRSKEVSNSRPDSSRGRGKWEPEEDEEEVVVEKEEPEKEGGAHRQPQAKSWGGAEGVGVWAESLRSGVHLLRGRGIGGGRSSLS